MDIFIFIRGLLYSAVYFIISWALKQTHDGPVDPWFSIQNSIRVVAWRNLFGSYPDVLTPPIGALIYLCDLHFTVLFGI